MLRNGHGDRVRGQSTVFFYGPQPLGAIGVERITSDAECFPEVVAVLHVQIIQLLVCVQKGTQ